MREEEIKRYAYWGVMPEQPLQSPERCLWYALRELYQGYRAGTMTAEQGMAAGDRLKRQYRLDRERLLFADRVLRHNAGMWQAIEYAARMYRERRTVEAADAFVEAVYGCRMKEG
ncbi:MAG: hypothetical protein IJQ02_11650 [Oscillospiraceae bacterium]|nr:hypothetical protein [Oscillospiraceae bacterium]